MKLKPGESAARLRGLEPVDPMAHGMRGLPPILEPEVQRPPAIGHLTFAHRGISDLPPPAQDPRTLEIQSAGWRLRSPLQESSTASGSMPGRTGPARSSPNRIWCTVTRSRRPTSRLIPPPRTATGSAAGATGPSRPPRDSSGPPSSAANGGWSIPTERSSSPSASMS